MITLRPSPPSAPTFTPPRRCRRCRQLTARDGRVWCRRWHRVQDAGGLCDLMKWGERWKQ